MSNHNPAVPPPPATVEADPKRPYKAYAAFVMTLLGLLWASLEGRDNLDNMTVMEWAAIIIPVILTTGTVYGIRNPKAVDLAGGTPPDAVVRDDRGAASVPLMLIIAGIVLAVVGYLAPFVILMWIGIVLAIVGVIMMLVGSSRGAGL